MNILIYYGLLFGLLILGAIRLRKSPKKHVIFYVLEVLALWCSSYFIRSKGPREIYLQIVLMVVVLSYILYSFKDRYSKYFINIAFGILGVIVLLVLGFWSVYRKSPIPPGDNSQVYTSNMYGYSFKYPMEWLVIDAESSLSDYLSANGTRSFVAIYSNSSRQDFSARIDTYNRTLPSVLQDNPMLKSKATTQEKINNINWTKIATKIGGITYLNYLVQNGDNTIDVACQSEDCMQILSDFVLGK